MFNKTNQPDIMMQTNPIEASIQTTIPNSRSQTKKSLLRDSQIKSCRKYDVRVSDEVWRIGFLLILMFLTREYLLLNDTKQCSNDYMRAQREEFKSCYSFIIFASGHIVLTRDDNGQSLVLTGEDGKGGKGKGKGKGGGGGDQLVITGNMGPGGGKNTNMVVQDAANREGDVVINGNSMVIPGEDGHIVLADGRSDQSGSGTGPRGPPPNLFAFWMPYLYNGFGYRPMQFFGGGQFG